MKAKRKILTVVSGLLKASSVVAGLSVYAGYLPPQVAPAALIVFASVSALKDFLKGVGDILDDGKKNNSFGKDK